MIARVLSLLLFLCVSCALVLPSVSGADSDSPEQWSQRKVRAGIFADAPFAIPDPAMGWTGFSVDLLMEISSRVNLEIEYVPYPTLPDLYQALRRGDVEIGVGNILVTSRGVEDLEFTQPILDGGLRIMVSGDKAHSLRRLWDGLVTGGHVRVLMTGALFTVFVSVGLLVFLRVFDAEFTRRWRDGFAESFYHVMSVFVTGKTNYSGNLGRGWIGRIVAALWLCFGVATVAYVTSSVASVMTTNSLAREVNGPADLPGRVIGVLEGSPAVRYVASQGLVSFSYKTLDDAVTALVDHQVDAVVSDSSSLEYYDFLHPTINVNEVGPLFERRHYAFALNVGSDETRRRLNVGLLFVRESGVLEHIRTQWFVR